MIIGIISIIGCFFKNKILEYEHSMLSILEMVFLDWWVVLMWMTK